MTDKGRGFVVGGLVVLLAGLAIGVALYVISLRRPAATVERFARAPVGCATTLSFAEAGSFFVYEETGNAGQGLATGCEPAATPSATFAVEFTGDRRPADVSTTTESTYDIDEFVGRSVVTVQIAEPGEYVIEVVGADTTAVAAVGGDPDEGVDDLRRSAVAAAVVGTLVGVALLMWARRRDREEPALGGDDQVSSRAAWGPPTAPPTEGPGLPVQPVEVPREPQAELAGWPPTPPDIATGVVDPVDRSDDDLAGDDDVNGDGEHVDVGPESAESQASPWARDVDETPD